MSHIHLEMGQYSRNWSKIDTTHMQFFVEGLIVVYLLFLITTNPFPFLLVSTLLISLGNSSLNGILEKLIFCLTSARRGACQGLPN